ncbi:MAG TPA: citrate (Si)-synthase [Lentisphaeria bacterium]|jgi:citrate synthase|nr:citrate (Si)-synthase [Lentisphaeria bacterium]
MSDVATISLEGKTYEFPIIEGTEGEKAIDIRTLRSTTGYITMDPGFGSSGCCESQITFIDGEKGILRFRGIPIEELAENSSFIETSYLLLHGELPTQAQLSHFEDLISQHSMVHEDMADFLRHFPLNAHPMCVLGSSINALASFHPGVNARSLNEDVDQTAAQLIAKVCTLAAYSYKKSVGEPFVQPQRGQSYCENFLNMMFTNSVNGYEADAEAVKAMNMLLLMHADHEQNCSATAVRVVGSSHADLYASISAGVSALWGPLHGGANQAVMEMLAEIHESGKDLQHFIDKAKDKSNDFRLSGFGHRVYKNYDPRARVIKKACLSILQSGAANDPLLDIAMRLEQRVLEDDYFIQRKLYPNVDFYSGLLYQAMGFPVDMFTVLFAIGRLPGWIAQWKELINDPDGKIVRPRQIYQGNNASAYVPMDQRG